MLTSPTTLTINGTARSFEKLREQDGNSSWMASFINGANTVEWLLNVRHANEKLAIDKTQMQRHNVELIRNTYETASGKLLTSWSTYVVVRNLRGGDITSAGKDAEALFAWAAANSTALIAGNA